MRKSPAQVIKVTVTDTVKVADCNRAQISPERRENRLITPPWHGIRPALRILAGRKFLEDVIEPTLADVGYEYCEAITLQRDREACAIKWFGLLRIILVVLGSPVLRLLQKLRSLTG